MRKIKFRTYNLRTKKMDYNPDYNSSSEKINDSFRHTKEIIEMQYTGLKDKNGKEIYEGDICKFYFKVDSNNKRLEIGEVVLCEYDDNEDYLVSVHYGWNINGFPLNDSDFEVIGNIYEHPEL